MPYTDEEVAEEVDDMPSGLREGTESDDVEIPGEDVSAAEVMVSEDVIPPAQGVTFEITKAFIDTYTPKEEKNWQKRSLKLYVAVGKEGVDGKGRYAKKNFFPRILVAVNREDYKWTHNAQGKPTDYYTPGSGSAWGEYNEFLAALGFPTKPAPANNLAFRQSLIGRKFIADITKENRRAKDASGNYKRVEGEFENHLRNLRPVKQAASTEQAAEAAAS